MPNQTLPIRLVSTPPLARRGLRGVKLVISDAHEGLKAAITKALSATWQRCRVHFMRNLLAHANRQSRRLADAFIGTIFAQDTKAAAKAQWRKVTEQMRPSLPKLAAFMDEGEEDVLAYMDFAPAHWVKLHSTNPIERPNGEIDQTPDECGWHISERGRDRSARRRDPARTE